MKHPDSITELDEYWAHIEHQAARVAQANGYDSVTGCAISRYGWDAMQTHLTPAEFVVARHKAREADAYWAPKLEQEPDPAKQDAIADEWERQTAPIEHRLGA